jgi:hypothetical protein
MSNQNDNHDIASIATILLGNDTFTEACGMSNNRIELQYGKIDHNVNKYIYSLYEGCSGLDYQVFDTKEELLVYLEKMDPLLKEIYPNATDDILIGVNEVFGFEV